MSFGEDRKYKEMSSVVRAIEYLKNKRFKGFIVNRGGPGGADIICNRNGHLCIVEVKGISGRELTMKDISSKSKELEEVLQTSLKYLEHYTKKGRHTGMVRDETIIMELKNLVFIASEKKIDIIELINDLIVSNKISRNEGKKLLDYYHKHKEEIYSEHPMVIMDKLSEIEQTKQALARYVTGKGDQIIERILYVNGGRISSKLQIIAKLKNFTIIHSDMELVKSKTFNNIYRHPDEGGMPAVSTPGIRIEVDNLFKRYKHKTGGDIQ